MLSSFQMLITILLELLMIDERQSRRVPVMIHFFFDPVLVLLCQHHLAQFHGDLIMALLMEVMQVRCHGLVVFNASCIKLGLRFDRYLHYLALINDSHTLQDDRRLSENLNDREPELPASSLEPQDGSGNYDELPAADDLVLVLWRRLEREKQQQQDQWVEAVRRYLSVEDAVELCEEGVGGTYFIKDVERNCCIAVFKPVDEEPGAMLNPKKRLLKPLMPPGGGAIREVAAFLLDTNHAARVPETQLIHNLQHKLFNNRDQVIVPKTGSLQKYIKNMGHSDSLGSACFPVSDVHHIGILDIRMLNLDRNGENILIVKDEVSGNFNLVPIDHSYTLPETLEDQFFHFEWLYWRQAKKPFNEKTLEFIASMDIEADSKVLTELGINPKAITLMRFSTILLKKAAAARMTLYQIACWITPKPRNEVSQFRKLVEITNQELAYNNIRPPQRDDVDRIFEQLVDELISSSQS